MKSLTSIFLSEALQMNATIERGLAKGYENRGSAPGAFNNLLQAEFAPDEKSELLDLIAFIFGNVIRASNQLKKSFPDKEHRKHFLEVLAKKQKIVYSPLLQKLFIGTNLLEKPDIERFSTKFAEAFYFVIESPSSYHYERDDFGMNFRLFIDGIKKYGEKSFAGESEDDPFEKYAFADERLNTPKERDTNNEHAVFAQLDDFFEGENNAIKKESAELMIWFMKEGKYPDIFIPTKAKVLYRGRSLSRKRLQKILNFGNDAKLPAFGKKKLDGMKYMRHGDWGSSWTRDMQVARNFASKRSEFRTILITKPVDNPDKFLDADGLYQIPAFSALSEEHETIGLGPIVLDSIYWVHSGYIKVDLIKMGMPKSIIEMFFG